MTGAQGMVTASKSSNGTNSNPIRQICNNVHRQDDEGIETLPDDLYSDRAVTEADAEKASKWSGGFWSWIYFNLPVAYA
eukprot:1320914-Amphidinium_carterae.1